MMSEYAIEVQNLAKTFGKGDQTVKAVQNISLQVKKGEILGFLGPNGAGKTTSLRMMVGLLKPTEGRVIIMGRDPNDKAHREELKRMIGIIPQEVSLYLSPSFARVFFHPFYTPPKLFGFTIRDFARFLQTYLG